MNYTGEPLNILHTIGLKELYPLIRISFVVGSDFDLTRFKQAILLCSKAVPELFCKHVLNNNSFVPVTNDLSDILFSDPQLRIFLNKVINGYRITIYLSHILTDGTGSKQFLYLLAKAYNTGKIAEKNHQDITWIRKLLKEHPVKPNPQVDHPGKPLSMPALANSKNKRRRTITYRLSKVETNKLRYAAHQAKVTLNDLFMAAFGWAVQRYSDTDKISLACPTDMRQFIPGKGELRIANHTSRYNISVKSSLDQPFEKVVNTVHQAMNKNKEQFQCFQSIQELVANYDNYSLSDLQKIVEENYHVRNISYTNFGIIDDQKFSFRDCKITDFTMLGTYRKYPMFQVAVSTYSGQINFSFAMFGNDEEERMGKTVILTMVDLLRSFLQKAV